MAKQKDSRVTFTSEDVRGDAIYAFRQMLKSENLDEGEYLSKLFEDAVLKEHGGAGQGMLNVYKGQYRRSLE